MSNFTRQEIIDAYTAVTTLARLAEEFTPVGVEEHKEINDLHLAVCAALPPRPQPTMAEIEWDDDKHYLAEAEVRTESEGGVKVVMLNPTPSRQVLCLHRAYSTPGAYRVSPDHLTPTGKRYALMEIQE